MRSRAVEFQEAFIEAKAPNEKIAIGMFSRIIIIADEVDNESLGYTVDELKELISDTARGFAGRKYKECKD